MGQKVCSFYHILPQGVEDWAAFPSFRAGGVARCRIEVANFSRARPHRYVVPEVQWYELLEWAFNYLAMSAPLQMLVGYGVGLLIAEAREKQRPNSWRRCNAVAWVVRAVYYLFYCGWVFLGFWKSWVCPSASVEIWQF